MGRQYFGLCFISCFLHGLGGMPPRNILVFLCHLVQYEANIRLAVISYMSKSGGELPLPPSYTTVFLCIQSFVTTARLDHLLRYNIRYTMLVLHCHVSLHVLYLHFITIYTVYILQSSLSLSKYVF